MDSNLKISAKLALESIYFPIDSSAFLHVFSKKETVCGVNIIDDKFFICMQGTSNLAGWEADIEIQPIKHKKLGFLHKGFYKNLPGIINQLLPIIPIGMEVILTGHSKGAAEAALLAALLKLSGLNIKEVILFACPNPGFKEFSDYMRKNIIGTSYVNKSMLIGDVVPEIPTLPYYHPYHHTKITEYPKWTVAMFPSAWHDAELYLRAFLK